MPAAARDPSRRGALLAALTVAIYVPLQPLLAWLARAGGVPQAGDLDGLARLPSTAVVLLLGAGLALVLAVEWRRRRAPGTMQRWATGLAGGLAVLIVLSALLTLAQALLLWAAQRALAAALAVDAALLAWLGAIAIVAVQPRGGPVAAEASAPARR